MTRRRTQAGFTFLELMVAMAMASILLLSTLSFVTYSYRSITDQRALSARNRVMLNLIRTAGTTGAIRTSSLPQAGNERLHYCVRGFHPTDHCQTGPTDIFDFKLYAPIVGENAGSLKLSGVLAGTEAEPVRYSLLGNACDPSAQGITCPPDDYPITAYTKFRAFCAPYWGPIYNQMRPDENPPLGDAKEVVNDRSSWTSHNKKQELLPLGLIAPSSCWWAEEIEVYITLEPTPGQVGKFFGSMVEFPKITMKTYVHSVEAQHAYDIP